MPEETRDSSTAVCPYCGYRHRDMYEVLQKDYEDYEFECGECERKIRTTLTIHHCFTTVGLEDANA